MPTTPTASAASGHGEPEQDRSALAGVARGGRDVVRGVRRRGRRGWYACLRVGRLLVRRLPVGGWSLDGRCSTGTSYVGATAAWAGAQRCSGVTASGPAFGTPGGGGAGLTVAAASLRRDMNSQTTRATRISGPGTQNQSHCPTSSATPRMPTRMSATLRLRSSRPSGGFCWPSSGRRIQQAAYTMRPAPPKRESTTNATRTISGSMSRCRAMPPATPATLRSATVRWRRPRSRTCSEVTRGPVGCW